MGPRSFLYLVEKVITTYLTRARGYGRMNAFPPEELYSMWKNFKINPFHRGVGEEWVPIPEEIKDKVRQKIENPDQPVVNRVNAKRMHIKEARMILGLEDTEIITLETIRERYASAEEANKEVPNNDYLKSVLLSSSERLKEAIENGENLDGEEEQAAAHAQAQAQAAQESKQNAETPPPNSQQQ